MWLGVWECGAVSVGVWESVAGSVGAWECVAGSVGVCGWECGSVGVWLGVCVCVCVCVCDSAVLHIFPCVSFECVHGDRQATSGTELRRASAELCGKYNVQIALNSFVCQSTDIAGL